MSPPDKCKGTGAHYCHINLKIKLNIVTDTEDQRVQHKNVKNGNVTMNLKHDELPNQPT